MMITIMLRIVQGRQGDGHFADGRMAILGQAGDLEDGKND